MGARGASLKKGHSPSSSAPAAGASTGTRDERPVSLLAEPLPAKLGGGDEKTPLLKPMADEDDGDDVMSAKTGGCCFACVVM